MKLNSRLDIILQDLRDFVLNNQEATPRAVADYFSNSSPEDFVKYLKDELWIDRKGIAFKTFEQYQYCTRLVEKHWHGQERTFSELTEDNLRQFEYQLKMVGMGRTTIKHTLTILSKYSKRAVRQGKLKLNPFDNYKIASQQETEKEWTDLDEIERLKGLWTNRKQLPERLHSTLIHYLHSCHCGLRAIDSRRLRTKDHVKNGFISMVLSKTANISQVPVRIPLNDYALELHSAIDDHQLKLSHWRIGKDLKELCELAKVNKHITFHCARHSFAINSLIKGIRIEVVSKWLGHRKLTTTQIYAKIVDSLSGSEMEKWNQNQTIKIDLTELGLDGKFNSKAAAIRYIKSKIKD